jgi:hypothetical protein
MAIACPKDSNHPVFSVQTIVSQEPVYGDSSKLGRLLQAPEPPRKVESSIGCLLSITLFCFLGS